MRILRDKLLQCDFANELEIVSTDLADAENQLSHAETHIGTASQITTHDYDAILQTCYAAARKALQAALAGAGLRVKSPPGNHWTFIKISRLEIFTQEIWQDLKWLRERRNDAEYVTIDAPEISKQEADEAILAASAMVADVKRLLGELS